MTRHFAFGSLLLLSTALFPPAALAQAADAAQPIELAAAPEAAPEAAPGQAGEEVDISIPGADLPSEEGGEIVVTGDRGTRNIVRASPQVLNILSQEDIERTGDGDIAGALQRVTGLSLVGNGFVFVRGLGDRYSLALLNGSPLPSPEPLRRVVPLDIFPTGIIASSLVQKTYSPNFPGEFGGGVINLTTRAIPEESFLSVGLGTGGDSETTFNLGYTYYGSDTDWSGFDDGTRNLPGGLAQAVAAGNFNAATTPQQRRDFAASLVNAPTTLLQRNRNIPANFSASLSGGTSTPVFGDGRLGVIAALGYSTTWRTRDALQQTSLDPGLAGLPQRSFQTVITDNRVLVNGMLGFGLEVGEHRFRLTNLYLRDTLKQGRLASGFNRNVVDPDPALPASLIEQNSYWFERQLIDTQFVAELDFGALDVDLRGTYATTQRESPYERDISYFYLGDGDESTKSASDVDDYVNNLSSNGQFANIAFSDLSETVLAGGIDLSYAFDTLPLTLTGGYAYTKTERSASRFQFQYFAGGGALPVQVAQQRPDYLLSDFNIHTYDIQLRDVSGAEGASTYEANLVVNAAYLQADAGLVTGMKLNGGVRFERAEQTVRPIGANLAATRLDNEYLLPALTLTYAFAPDVQARLHASRTIARPQFRELAPQLYQDFESDREFTGNPFLEDSRLTNVEGRVEYDFVRQQRLAASAFYKKIDNPIEAAAFFAGGGQLRTGFANAPSAELYGAEIELQTSIPLEGLGGFFATRRLLLIGNYTYTQSRVGSDDSTIVGPDLQPVAANLLFQDGAPLTGQSDHLVNAQISFEDTESLSQLTLLVNYASERVTNRGPIQGINRQPDIVERPGLRLDLVARQGVRLFGGEAELQLEARNLLREGYEEYQEVGGNRISVNTYDVGTSISLGVNVKF